VTKRETEIAQFLGQILGQASKLSLYADPQAPELLRGLDQLARQAGDVFLAWTGQSLLDLPYLSLESLEPRERIRDAV
jgi:hypothetical protein